MGVGFVVGVLGVLLLSHAAYSTIQYRALLKITEDEFTGPSLNVIVELLSGLILCMWAALTVPGKFLSILPDSDENSWNEIVDVLRKQRGHLSTLGSSLYPPIWIS